MEGMMEEKALVIRDEIPLPEDVLGAAQRASKALMDVVSKKKKPVIINKETYLEYEDWQTVGQFYGYSVKTGDAIPIEVDGVRGAKAKAELLDKNGCVVSGAEAYCMKDETNWKNKPWFMLASMAQTRAGAKAFRNRLAWVVVLAGFKPTPAEEMDGTHTNGEMEGQKKEGKEEAPPPSPQTNQGLGQLDPEVSANYLAEVIKHLDGYENLFQLRNGFKKHFHEWSESLTPEDMQKVIAMKDAMKMKFEEGKP